MSRRGASQQASSASSLYLLQMITLLALFLGLRTQRLSHSTAGALFNTLLFNALMPSANAVNVNVTTYTRSYGTNDTSAYFLTVINKPDTFDEHYVAGFMQNTTAGQKNCFMGELSANGSLMNAISLGASSGDCQIEQLHAASNGDLYFAGVTNSNDLNSDGNTFHMVFIGSYTPSNQTFNSVKVLDNPSGLSRVSERLGGIHVDEAEAAIYVFYQNGQFVPSVSIYSTYTLTKLHLNLSSVVYAYTYNTLNVTGAAPSDYPDVIRELTPGQLTLAGKVRESSHYHLQLFQVNKTDGSIIWATRFRDVDYTLRHSIIYDVVPSTDPDYILFGGASDLGDAESSIMSNFVCELDIIFGNRTRACYRMGTSGYGSLSTPNFDQEIGAFVKLNDEYFLTCQSMIHFTLDSAGAVTEMGSYREGTLAGNWPWIYDVDISPDHSYILNAGRRVQLAYNTVANHVSNRGLVRKMYRDNNTWHFPIDGGCDTGIPQSFSATYVDVNSYILSIADKITPYVINYEIRDVTTNFNNKIRKPFTLVDDNICIVDSTGSVLTSAPTQSPTLMPTASPTTPIPTASPTTPIPTVSPTPMPSTSPTASPTIAPTTSPTISPTTAIAPTKEPTPVPSPVPQTGSPTTTTTISSDSPSTTLTTTVATNTPINTSGGNDGTDEKDNSILYIVIGGLSFLFLLTVAFLIYSQRKFKTIMANSVHKDNPTQRHVRSRSGIYDNLQLTGVSSDVELASIHNGSQYGVVTFPAAYAAPDSKLVDGSEDTQSGRSASKRSKRHSRGRYQPIGLTPVGASKSTDDMELVALDLALSQKQSTQPVAKTNTYDDVSVARRAPVAYNLTSLTTALPPPASNAAPAAEPTGATETEDDVQGAGMSISSSVVTMLVKHAVVTSPSRSHSASSRQSSPTLSRRSAELPAAPVMLEHSDSSGDASPHTPTTPPESLTAAPI